MLDIDVAAGFKNKQGCVSNAIDIHESWVIDTMVALTLYNNRQVEDIGESPLTGYVSRRGDLTRQKYLCGDI